MPLTLSCVLERFLFLHDRRVRWVAYIPARESLLSWYDGLECDVFAG